MITSIKTLPATQVKNTFGKVVNQVYKGRYEAVIVENHGQPVAAIIPAKELEIMKEFKEEKRRKDALLHLRQVRDEIQARMKRKLTDIEAMKIADRFSHDLIEDLAKEGKIKFERDSS